MPQDDGALDGLLWQNLSRPADAGATATCPEPETIAAYADRSLGDGEIAEYELHFASCRRCREQLAALAALGVEFASPEHSEASPESDLRPFPQSLFGPVNALVADHAKSDSQGRGTPVHLDWRWLAPLAAAILLTILIYPRIAPRGGPAAPGEAEVAKLQPPPSSTSSEPAAAVAARKELAAPGAKSARAATAFRTYSQKSKTSDTAASSKSSSDQATGAMSRIEVSGSASQSESEPSHPTDLKKTPGLETNSGNLVLRAVPAPARVAAGAAPEQKSPKATTGQISGSAAQSSGLTENRFSQRWIESGQMQSVEQRSAGISIPTPYPKVLWRIAEAGFVERSEDGGGTWQGQLVDGNASFLAGAAPDAKTCWLVGREGIIYLTRDASRWKKLKPPADSDITAIVAKDSRSATITLSDGGKFATHNRGKSWKAVS